MAALTRCITRKGHTMCAGMAPEERICDEDAETQLRGSGVWGECKGSKFRVADLFGQYHLQPD